MVNRDKGIGFSQSPCPFVKQSLMIFGRLSLHTNKKQGVARGIYPSDQVAPKNPLLL
jgi:hypothetical protein